MSMTTETAWFHWERAVKLRLAGDQRLCEAERRASDDVPALLDEIAQLRLIVQMRRDVFTPELLPVHA
jgi:hypothetical protein